MWSNPEKDSTDSEVTDKLKSGTVSFFTTISQGCPHSCFGAATPGYLTAWTIWVLKQRHRNSNDLNQVLCSHREAT